MMMMMVMMVMMMMQEGWNIGKFMSGSLSAYLIFMSMAPVEMPLSGNVPIIFIFALETIMIVLTFLLFSFIFFK